MLADPASRSSPEPASPVRVLVADPRDVRRAGVLLALQRLAWVEACAGARTEADAVAVAAAAAARRDPQR